MSRRDFLEIVGLGSAAAVLGTPALASFEMPPDELQRWRRDLLSPSQPKTYSSEKHTDARLHLGGIGTGNFEIGVDGQLTTWQLFNTLRDGQVPFYFLAKVGGVTRMLQTKGGPEWPRVSRIEMTGEYPFATLRFHDPELPVHLELSAFTPFAPLDSGMSSAPVAAFTFHIHNRSDRAQKVSLAALMQNPVGYEAYGDNAGMKNACFGGNRNEVLKVSHGGGLLMGALPAAEPTLERPVTIFVSPNLKELNAPPVDRPANLTLKIIDDGSVSPQNLAEPSSSVFWLEDAGTNLTAETLKSLLKAVEAGATLLFAGRTQPLLGAYASWTGGKPVGQANSRADVLFEDFESGYGNWQVEGNAFGQGPAQGTLPNQQHVSGFTGRGLVNTYLGGDDTKGRLISKPFQISRRYIRFLVGGGHFDETQIRLIVDGKVARAAAGKDNERLEPTIWDVSEFEGRSAHLEIVDERTGGWGHINVDQIEFSDLQGSRDVMLLLEELLPARFNRVHARANGSVEFASMELRPGATETKTSNGLRLFSHGIGKGKVIMGGGALLTPDEASATSARQEAYRILCGLVGAEYRSSPGIHPKAPGFGTLALVALHGDASVLVAGQDFSEAWDAFTATGHFTKVSEASPSQATAPGQTILGAVSATVTVPAGKSLEVPFLLTWHYPNKYAQNGEWIGCHYATRWTDAASVAVEAANHFKEWRERTERFRRVFYDSSLPYWLLDCITANAAIMRHIGIVFRIANGDVYGWEGSNGCCDPTCTHVWGYEQSFSRLFPDLEKEMRRIDFKHQQRADGGVNNRTEVPSPGHPTGEQPFADGHASCVLKAYREALNHPDESFFREYWAHVKQAVEYLISRDAASAGGTPAGILQDDQWNTYDEALHGVTTFISGYYL
ncbi:MAG TPA: GH116 family glycosyl-hydrolase, partial [Verrucomicrobiae bacterium]|nr:GH116 family glycosyl-hydrolase [Verrucomicrobiae bacterium]